MAEAIAWRSRPPDQMYRSVFFDALRVKIRSDGGVTNKSVYPGPGIQADCNRDVLALLRADRGAKFWFKVFNNLKARGCHDILIAVFDGLKGRTDAINTGYPKMTVQNCVVNLIRNSLDYADWKDRKLVAQALRPTYTAVSEEAARDSANGSWA